MMFWKTPAPDTASTDKKESLAAFLFNPRFGRSARPLGASYAMFVRFIALLFAANGLFPKNHPALVGDIGMPLSVREIIGTAFQTIRFTREGLPQAILFFAVVGALLFSSLAVVTIALILLTGTAHATTSCTNSGVFDRCSDSDMAYQWLEYLFNNGTITDTLGYAVPQTNIIQTTLRACLAFFSDAVLVLAGIILMYHLLAMVVETAHTGKPMGSANQIWAPIRLVVAVGLLIPVSSSGLNVGQSIAVQVAEWGSGLASQTWNKFLTSLSDISAQKMFIAPKVPPSNIGKATEHMILMRACMYAFNHEMQLSSSVVSPTALTTLLVTKRTDTLSYGNKATGGSAAAGAAICGKWGFPEVQSTDKLASAIYTAYKEVGTLMLADSDSFGIDAAAKKVAFYSAPTGEMTDFDKEIWAKVNISSAQTRISHSDAMAASNAVWNAVKTKLSNNEISSTLESTSKEIVEQWAKDGWAAAGAWFNTIARVQSFIDDAASSAFVQTTPPDLEFILNAQDALPSNSFGTNNTGIRALKETNNNTAESALGHITTLLGQFSEDMGGAGKANDGMGDTMMAGTEGITNGKMGTGFDATLNVFDALMQQAAAFPNSSAGDYYDAASQALHAPSTQGQALFSLTSANPLAELANYGHRFLTAGSTIWVLGLEASVGGDAANAAFGSVGAGLGANKHGKLEALTKLVGSGLDIGGELIGSVFCMLGAVAMGIGMTLTFVLPMIPFVHFYFGVLVWLLVVMESVVSAPLFALAHLNPQGEGLPGGMARPGYFFLLGILIRPVLMIFGLMSAYLLFFVATSFLNKMFLVAAYGTGAYGGFAALSKLIFSVMYAVLAYICANTCFKAIDHFPDSALSWMSAQGPRTQSLGDPAGFTSKIEPALAYFGTQGLNRLSSQITGATSRMGASTINAADGMKSDTITSRNTRESSAAADRQDKTAENRHQELVQGQSQTNTTLNNIHNRMPPPSRRTP